MSIRIGIIAPTGYTGLALIELLLRHPGVQINYLASRRDPPPNMVEEFGQLLGRLPESAATCGPIDVGVIAKKVDVVFCCLPHTVAMDHVPALLDAGLKVIDLSADYRVPDAKIYEKAYGHQHVDAAHLHDGVYGLPEYFRNELQGANLVANPGCFPTATILGIAPLLKRGIAKSTGIIVNGASGVTGAGRTAKTTTHFPELNESFYAYRTIGGHQHQPEMIHFLSEVGGSNVDLLFVPHLLPVDRGILTTIYADSIDGKITQEDLFQAFETDYGDEPFVRVRRDLPNIKFVRGTNCCDITVRLVDTANGPKIVVFSAIDNMIKGASGQALQNMNILLGLEETAGLI